MNFIVVLLPLLFPLQNQPVYFHLENNGEETSELYLIEEQYDKGDSTVIAFMNCSDFYKTLRSFYAKRWFPLCCRLANTPSKTTSDYGNPAIFKIGIKAKRNSFISYRDRGIILVTHTLQDLI